MSTERPAVNTILRLLRDRVEWPKLRPGERIDLYEHGAGFHDVMSTPSIEIRACRYNEDEPLRGETRYAREVIDLRRYMATGNKSELVDQFLSALRTMAVVLSGALPKGWRLFGRPKRAPVFRSRLLWRTR